MGQTLFLKHKYLTQPTIVDTDELLQAGDDICNALANIAPATDKKRQAIDFLMDIFKGQAKKNESGTYTQIVVMEVAQAQRVIADKAEQTTCVQSEDMIMYNDNLRTIKELELYYPSKDTTANNGAPESINKEESTPASKTRASRQRKLLISINVSDSWPTAEQSASRS